jgi:hypothetical protein
LQTRATLGVALPLAKSFAGGERHLLEPYARLDAFHAANPRSDSGQGSTTPMPVPLPMLVSYDSETLAATAPRGVLALPSSGMRSVQGGKVWQWETRAALGTFIGASNNSSALTLRPATRAFTELQTRVLAGSLSAAYVGRSAWALMLRARFGRRRGYHLVLSGFAIGAEDPYWTRVLGEDERESAIPFAARSGLSASAHAEAPVTRWLKFFGGADIDASARELLGARAGIELRDKCDCIAFRAQGSQRQGREGVDAWLEIDFRPP